MELPASDELLAMENEHIFRFNGFDIEVDEEAPVGQRIKLVSMPISKSTKKIGFTVEGGLIMEYVVSIPAILSLYDRFRRTAVSA